jgi:hypothetical protein
MFDYPSGGQMLAIVPIRTAHELHHTARNRFLSLATFGAALALVGATFLILNSVKRGPKAFIPTGATMTAIGGVLLILGLSEARHNQKGLRAAEPPRHRMPAQPPQVDAASPADAPAPADIPRGKSAQQVDLYDSDADEGDSDHESEGDEDSAMPVASISEWRPPRAMDLLLDGD